MSNVSEYPAPLRAELKGERVTLDGRPDRETGQTIPFWSFSPAAARSLSKRLAELADQAEAAETLGAN